MSTVFTDIEVQLCSSVLRYIYRWLLRLTYGPYLIVYSE